MSGHRRPGINDDGRVGSGQRGRRVGGELAVTPVMKRSMRFNKIRNCVLLTVFDAVAAATLAGSSVTAISDAVMMLLLWFMPIVLIIKT